MTVAGYLFAFCFPCVSLPRVSSVSVFVYVCVCMWLGRALPNCSRDYTCCKSTHQLPRINQPQCSSHQYGNYQTTCVVCSLWFYFNVSHYKIIYCHLPVPLGLHLHLSVTSYFLLCPAECSPLPCTTRVQTLSHQLISIASLQSFFILVLPLLKKTVSRVKCTSFLLQCSLVFAQRVS